MTTAKLCIVVLAESMADLRRQRDAAADADLIELRLDTVRDVDVEGALAGRTRPIIVTCRPSWEGGQFQGSEEERHRILARALALGADYVDVEWKAGFADLLQPATRARVVLSSHDFEQLPADLGERARAMHASGAGVVKIAGLATRLSDAARLLEVARTFESAGGQRVFIAMGPLGEVSRVCAARFGSAWSYAGAVPGIGQIAPRTLVEQYRFKSITTATRIFGIVGRPVTHSVSPAMHNAAFRDAGVDAVYLSFPAVDADDFVTFARALGVSGASVTIPYKVALAERANDVDPLARRIGAINTLRMGRDGWEAKNTDITGFLRPLRDRGVRLDGCRVAVLGSGGSARAVVVGLSTAGALVTIHARNSGRARALAAEGGAQAGEWPPARGSWDLLVNCTPLGMYPDVVATPVPAESLGGGLVYDLVYNPLDTRLLREAGAAGCATIGGLDMLVAQAQDQFEWWVGTRPDADVMRAAALSRLAEFRTP